MSTRGRHGIANAWALHTAQATEKFLQHWRIQLAGPQIFTEHLLCAGEASALSKHKYKKLNV